MYALGPSDVESLRNTSTVSEHSVTIVDIPL